MKIEAYIIVWNREDTIHLTINHYKSFCSKVTIYDNFSDDRTREIAESLGADVRLFGKAGELNDQHYLDVKNHCWKGSKADYVIVCDDDEILWHPRLIKCLTLLDGQGVSIVTTIGFSIHSNDLPQYQWTEILSGQIDNNYSKSVIFSPKRISEIGYVYGCHESKPKSKNNLQIYFSKTVIPLLHYRSVGGFGRLQKRHNRYRERLSQINKKWNLGDHYSESDSDKRKVWDDGLKNSKNIYEVLNDVLDITI